MNRRPWHLPYNGTSWPDRCAVIPVQEAAFRSGKLKRPSNCSICGFHGPGKRQGRWQIIYHLERYDRPLEIYPVCRPCHSALHARFADPERWQRMLRKYGRAGKWFTLISLDPQSQFRPFTVTYPTDLPPPFAM